jgi:2-aminoadipate transaminase
MNYSFSDNFKNLAPSALREILKNAGDPSIIAFAAGNPNAASFPLEEIRRLSADILEKN